MRTQPTTTRVAIATLYLRFRDDRRLAARARREHGPESPVALQRGTQEVTSWNAYVAASVAVADEQRGERPSVGARELLRLAAIRGRRAA